mmetsp:Transcript_121743/g.211414  ORF Transcript_121743/g.211414 Transcript_121743/m.211414 type:complete len:268 (+) Transcript_121743:482-1285(+)
MNRQAPPLLLGWNPETPTKQQQHVPCHVHPNEATCKSSPNNCAWSSGWFRNKCMHILEGNEKYKWGGNNTVKSVCQAVVTELSRDTGSVDHLIQQLQLIESIAKYLHTEAEAYKDIIWSGKVRLKAQQHRTAEMEERVQSAKRRGYTFAQAVLKDQTDDRKTIEKSNKAWEKQAKAAVAALQDLWKTWRTILRILPVSKWLLQGLETLRERGKNRRQSANSLGSHMDSTLAATMARYDTIDSHAKLDDVMAWFVQRRRILDVFSAAA